MERPLPPRTQSLTITEEGERALPLQWAEGHRKKPQRARPGVSWQLLCKLNPPANTKVVLASLWTAAGHQEKESSASVGIRLKTNDVFLYAAR